MVHRWVIAAGGVIALVAGAAMLRPSCPEPLPAPAAPPVSSQAADESLHNTEQPGRFCAAEAADADAELACLAGENMVSPAGLLADAEPNAPAAALDDAGGPEVQIATDANAVAVIAVEPNEHTSPIALDPEPLIAQRPVYTPVENGRPLELILLRDDQAPLAALAAPIAAVMKSKGRTPLLLAMPEQLTDAHKAFLDRIMPHTGSCTFLAAPGPGAAGAVSSLPAYPPVTDPNDCAVALAAFFWGMSKMAVIAPDDDPQAMILAATAAGRLPAPLIPLGQKQSLETLCDRLARELGVEQILFVHSSEAAVEPLATRFDAPARSWRLHELSCPQALVLLVEMLEPHTIEHLVVFRVPATGKESAIGWLAPWVSVMRDSLPIPISSGDPEAIDRQIHELIERHSLTPGTVTLLGDYGVLPTLSYTVVVDEAEQQIPMEPGAREVPGYALELGVGRIPFADAARSSLLLSRGYARERLVDAQRPSVLMIANTSPDYGPLPLAETISRATAAEFLNFAVAVRQFYGAPAYVPEVRSAAINADVILYEGHTADFYLFSNPDPYTYQEADSFDDVSDEAPEDWATLPPAQGDSAYGDPDSPTTISSSDAELAEPQDSGASAGSEEYSWESSIEDLPEPPAITDLQGLPLVVLQSCHSLDATAMAILQDGAVAIVGTISNVHSASGSSLVKAFCDEMLYRGDTLGESLRDAKNFMLCLADLKDQRGHSQQAKVRRVAHSFQLWGDPTLRLVDVRKSRPRIRPLTVTVEEGQVRIRPGSRRLAPIETEKYHLRLYPRSQAGGIVVSIKDRPWRRILPMYYSRVDRPAGLVFEGFPAFVPDVDGSIRSVCLEEPLGRYLYILHLPPSGASDDKVVLPFEP